MDEIKRDAENGDGEDNEMGITLPWWFRFTFYPDILRRTEGWTVLLAAAAGAVAFIIQGEPLKMLVAFDVIYVFLFF